MSFSSNSSSGYSTNSSSNASSSIPAAIQTPESELETAIAAAVAQIGSGVLNWASNIFTQTSSITDDMIGNYMTAASEGQDLAGNTLNEYENNYVPLQNQQIQDANSYSSTARINYNVGQAVAGAGQANAAAMNQVKQQLQAMGVNPSSPEYAEALAANAPALAASEAGAGQAAEQYTENTGRSLRQQALTNLEQLPAATVNALNTEEQALSGAENSALGLANTGVNLEDAAAPYYNAAMSLKYPPVGQVSASTGQSTGQSAQNSVGSSYSPSAVNSRTAGQQQNSGSGSSYNPNQPAADDTSPTFQGGNNAAGTYNDENAGGGGVGAVSAPSAGTSSFGGGIGTTWSGAPDTTAGSITGPVGPAIPSGMDQIPTSGDNPFAAGQTTPDVSQVDTSTSPSAAEPTADSNGGVATTDDYSQPEVSGSQTDTSAASSYGGYARGGDVNKAAIPITKRRPESRPIPLKSAIPPRARAQGGPTTGGFVPKNASPSQGQQTDDVPARLNADEFVIPRDVTHHLGTKYFQNLINKSRQTRLGMAGGGKMPPIGGQPKPMSRQQMNNPTFVSRAIP